MVFSHHEAATKSIEVSVVSKAHVHMHISQDHRQLPVVSFSTNTRDDTTTRTQTHRSDSLGCLFSRMACRCRAGGFSSVAGVPIKVYSPVSESFLWPEEEKIEDLPHLPNLEEK